MKKISRVGFIITVILIIIIIGPTLISSYMSGFRFTDDSGIDLKNFAIKDLTDEQIINTQVRCSIYMGGTSSSGESTGVEGLRYSEADKDNVRCYARKAVGLDTLITGKVTSGVLTFDIDVELTSGAAEIVVIRNNEIVERMAAQDTTLTYEVSEESTYIIKLLLEDAKIDINATRKITK